MTAFQEIWNPWLIGPFLWLAGISGMTAVAYVLLKWSGVEEKRRELSWATFISIVLALVFVIADLSRPWNMPSAIMSAVFGGTFGWTRSWMAVGIALLLVMLVLTLLVVLRHTGAGALRPLVDAKWFDALLLLVGVAVMIYSGFLIAVLEHGADTHAVDYKLLGVQRRWLYCCCSQRLCRRLPRSIALP